MYFVGILKLSMIFLLYPLLYPHFKNMLVSIQVRMSSCSCSRTETSSDSLIYLKSSGSLVIILKSNLALSTLPLYFVVMPIWTVDTPSIWTIFQLMTCSTTSIYFTLQILPCCATNRLLRPEIPIHPLKGDRRRVLFLFFILFTPP